MFYNENGESRETLPHGLCVLSSADKHLFIWLEEATVLQKVNRLLMFISLPLCNSSHSVSFSIQLLVSFLLLKGYLLLIITGPSLWEEEQQPAGVTVHRFLPQVDIIFETFASLLYIGFWFVYLNKQTSSGFFFF